MGDPVRNNGKDKNLPAHAYLDKGDPRVHGPYLDDIQADKEREFNERRIKASKENQSNVVELHSVRDEDDN